MVVLSMKSNKQKEALTKVSFPFPGLHAETKNSDAYLWALCTHVFAQATAGSPG